MLAWEKFAIPDVEVYQRCAGCGKQYPEHLLFECGCCLERGCEDCLVPVNGERWLKAHAEEHERLLAEPCEECGHPLKEHDPRYGCEHDRGDGYLAGVFQALGPCGCQAGVVQPGDSCRHCNGAGCAACQQNSIVTPEAIHEMLATRWLIEERIHA